MGSVGEPRAALAVGCPNDFPWLVMVVEEREPLVTSPIRLAKAKVAGSNPVFRSNPRPRFQRISPNRGLRVPAPPHRVGTKMEHPEHRRETAALSRFHDPLIRRDARPAST